MFLLCLNSTCITKGFTFIWKEFLGIVRTLSQHDVFSIFTQTIMHPTPRNILHNHCFQFLLGITVVPLEIQDDDYAKFWGVNRVHYGLCENGELNAVWSYCCVCVQCYVRCKTVFAIWIIKTIIIIIIIIIFFLRNLGEKINKFIGMNISHYLGEEIF